MYPCHLIPAPALPSLGATSLRCTFAGPRLGSLTLKRECLFFRLLGLHRNVAFVESQLTLVLATSGMISDVRRTSIAIANNECRACSDFGRSTRW